MINKAHIKIGDVIYGSSDSVDIIYDNTESGLESNNIQDAIDEIAAGACFSDGLVVNVEMANWIAQEDRTYTNTVAIEGILESEMYDVSLYGDSTEEQAHAFDFLVTDIDTYDGQIVLTASEKITVAFSVILRGKVNLENKNVYVSDLSATNIEYDNSESNMAATDMQNAIDELATTVNGIVVNVTADSWDIQEDGTYKKIIPVEQLTGKEVLDVCLYPGDTHTEEQILAYSELITSIDTIEGRLVLTATEAITVGFRILLYGKIGFEVVDGSGNSTSGSAKAITLTQEEYDALSEEEKANGIYVVSDGEDLTAKNLAYDGSVTGLGNNVQDAVDAVNSKVASNQSVEIKTSIQEWAKNATLPACAMITVVDYPNIVDSPSVDGQQEYVLEVFGHDTRRLVFAHVYNGSASVTKKRQMFQGEWLTGWFD